MNVQTESSGETPAATLFDLPLLGADDTLANRWDLALRRLDHMPGSEFDRVCRPLLDHLEAGWTLVEPLPHPQLTDAVGGYTEPVFADLGSLEPEAVAASVESFCHVNVVDAYRNLMNACADYVRGADSRDTPDLFDLLGETECMVESYLVLLLAASNPRMPEHIRERINHAAQLGEWFDTFRELYESFARRIELLMEEESAAKRVRGHVVPKEPVVRGFLRRQWVALLMRLLHAARC